MTAEIHQLKKRKRPSERHDELLRRLNNIHDLFGHVTTDSSLEDRIEDSMLSKLHNFYLGEIFYEMKGFRHEDFLLNEEDKTSHAQLKKDNKALESLIRQTHKHLKEYTYE